MEDAEEKEPQSHEWWADVARLWVAFAACETARPWRCRKPDGRVADNTIRAVNTACGVPLALTCARGEAADQYEIEQHERAVHQEVVRDIFANPSWRTSTAVTLAQ